MQKTVSLIIPCYSYAHYLMEALNSVKEQTVIPHEIIIVSDGAIDNSVQVAEEFKIKNQNLNVKIITKKNGGLASARNAGIKEAKGKYIISFDSDDILKPYAIEKHLELAGDNKVVTMGLMAFGSENYTARPQKATLEILLQRNVLYSNSLFPKALWEKIGGFDESETMRLGLEDWLAWIEMAEAGAEFVRGNDICLLWRRHSNAMSNVSANPNWAKLMAYFREKHKDLYEKYNI